MEFGKVLEVARIQAGLSRDQLAKKVEMSGSWVRDVERGYIPVLKPEQVAELAEGCKSSWLVEVYKSEIEERLAKAECRKKVSFISPHRAIMQTLKEYFEYQAEINMASEDGVITDGEMERIEKEGIEAINAINRSIQGLRQGRGKATPYPKDLLGAEGIAPSLIAPMEAIKRNGDG